jgi:L-alanine-DL-glutamate epimerase-like enolase superfamily enzyme
MKITQVRARTLRVPIAAPIVTATVTATDVWLLRVDLRTDDGAVGTSHIWSFNERISASLCAMTEELSRHVLGRDPTHGAQIWERIWKGTVQWGHSGIPVMATAALDVALWDMVGRIAGLSVCQLLGLRTPRVQTYASHGLWISDDLAALQKEAAGYVERGFRAMKMRAGRARIEQDVAAVRAVREAIGPEIGLMVDFGSAPSRDRALRLASALEPLELLWIEDPIVDEDPDEHAALARAIRTPVCFGEKVYTPLGFARLIAAGACDHLMADLQRVGGVTGWARIAALADAAHLPLSTHILPELNVQLVASAPTGAWLECMTWAAELFEERLQLVDGMMEVPMRPGFGFTWDEDRVRHAQRHDATWSA